MHQLFSFHRFWLLLKLDYTENGKRYLISSALIISFMLLLMAPITGSYRYNNLQETVRGLYLLSFPICLLIGGSLFTITAFASYSTPNKGISALMLPASRLEKFGAILLVNMLFMVAFIVIYWQLYHWFMQLYHRLMDVANQYTIRLRDSTIPKDSFLFLSYIYFLIQGVFFLGSIYFNKNAYIKTAGIFLILSIVAYLINLILAYQFTGNPPHVFAFPFISWRVSLERSFAVEFPESVQNLVWVFLVLLVVSMWYIAYIRFKEKEI